MFTTKGSKFYGVATNKDGKNIIIDNLTDEWVKARTEAERHCKLNGLTFEGIRKYAFKEDRNSVLTKNFKVRRKQRGQKGWKESGKLFFGN